jgi:hypothetical protein
MWNQDFIKVTTAGPYENQDEDKSVSTRSFDEGE